MQHASFLHIKIIKIIENNKIIIKIIDNDNIVV